MPPVWQYSHLRAIDQVEASTPEGDVIALYTRTLDDQLQIRLDLLEYGGDPDYDLYLAFDSLPGGTNTLPISARAGIEWDRLLVIPAQGDIQALDHNGQTVPAAAIRMIRDPLQDTWEISGNRLAFYPSDFPPAQQIGYQLQVFLTPAGSTQVSDQVGPVRSDQPPPPPAQALMVFWDSFPAYTPATALRRWSGAHTGPLGTSHGLSQLLTASQSAGIPLALLDLKSPTALSALDQMGHLDWIKELERSGAVILPDIAPETLQSAQPPQIEFITALEQLQSDITHRFGMTPSPFRFSPSGSLVTERASRLVFLPQEGAATQLTPITPVRWQDQVLIPLTETHSAAQSEQATSDGLALEVKRALIETALVANAPAGEAPPILLLGGALPESTWGSPLPSRAGFRYLHHHPWIKMLGRHDLAALRGQTVLTDLESHARPHPEGDQAFDTLELEQALLAASDNELSQAAWQAYLTLTAPVSPTSPDLPRLRANYIPVVWALLEASNWAAFPYEKSSCEIDPDRDGQYECLIATQETFALFEIQHGALTLAVMRPTAEQIYQIIAPSSQLITGLSDPLFWQLEAGDLSDPDVIPGAFAEPARLYQARLITPHQVDFYEAQSGAQKTITIDGQRISARYAHLGADPIQTVQAALALNPWIRFTPGWADAYHESYRDDRWEWQVDPLFSLQASATGEIAVFHFNQSRADLRRAENPNKDYPLGHFLPYPLAVLEIPAKPGLEIHLELVRNAIID